MRKTLVVAAMSALMLAACNPFDHDSDVVSNNLSQSADKFEVLRRVVFYNGITGEYMLSIEGFCALGNKDGPKELTVTCKVGDNEYKKHFLGLSDNVTYFVEQLDAATVSKHHYEVVFKPSVIEPDINIR